MFVAAEGAVSAVLVGRYTFVKNEPTTIVKNKIPPMSVKKVSIHVDEG